MGAAGVAPGPQTLFLSPMGEFVSDLAAIRRRARTQIDKGPVTGAYKADLPRVLEVLNEVLATELVCVLRYKRHYFTAAGINAQPVAAEFLQHANEEQGHAEAIPPLSLHPKAAVSDRCSLLQ